MRYLVAVSGGVDSVVLLYMYASKYATDQLVVAHFDHGIRPDSQEDRQFVQDLAGQYGLPFVTAREELGPDASEELARNRRYEFLRKAAVDYDATIVTAHHADDIVESVAINFIRGTGWRGLAVLDSPDIERPLLDMTKQELVTYASSHNLTWREDPTNNDTKYLRNSVRQKLKEFTAEDNQLVRLHRDRQIHLRKMIDAECSELIAGPEYSRYFFTTIPDVAAIELLRAAIVKETGQSMTRPQLQQALLAVKVYASGKQHQISDGISIRFTKREFVIER